MIKLHESQAPEIGENDMIKTINEKQVRHIVNKEIRDYINSLLDQGYGNAIHENWREDINQGFVKESDPDYYTTLEMHLETEVVIETILAGVSWSLYPNHWDNDNPYQGGLDRIESAIKHNPRFENDGSYDPEIVPSVEFTLDNDGDGGQTLRDYSVEGGAINSEVESYLADLTAEVVKVFNHWVAKQPQPVK